MPVFLGNTMIGILTCPPCSCDRESQNYYIIRTYSKIGLSISIVKLSLCQWLLLWTSRISPLTISISVALSRVTNLRAGLHGSPSSGCQYRGSRRISPLVSFIDDQKKDLAFYETLRHHEVRHTSAARQLDPVFIAMSWTIENPSMFSETLSGIPFHEVRSGSTAKFEYESSASDNIPTRAATFLLDNHNSAVYIAPKVPGGKNAEQALKPHSSERMVGLLSFRPWRWAFSVFLRAESTCVVTTDTIDDACDFSIPYSMIVLSSHGMRRGTEIWIRRWQTSSNPPYLDVHFVDSFHGWIVGGTEAFDGVFGVILDPRMVV